MPVIKAQQAIALLKPELPKIEQLIEHRNRQTGEVQLPMGVQARLFAEQELAGTKGARGKAIYFDQEAVNALLLELQQYRTRLREQWQRERASDNSLLALVPRVDPATARALRRIVARRREQETLQT